MNFRKRREGYSNPKFFLQILEPPEKKCDIVFRNEGVGGGGQRPLNGRCFEFFKKIIHIWASDHPEEMSTGKFLCFRNRRFLNLGITKNGGSDL